MKRRSKLFFHFYLMILSLLLSSGNLWAQVSSLKSSTFKIVLSGNQQFASMSVDGRIVFQSDYGVDSLHKKQQQVSYHSLSTISQLTNSQLIEIYQAVRYLENHGNAIFLKSLRVAKEVTRDWNE